MARALDTWDGSAWKPAKVLSVNDGTTWKPAKGAWVYDGAAWQQFWPVAPPVKPSLAYTGNGLFIIQNYDPAVVYSAAGGIQTGNQFVVGNASGDATLTPAWYAGGPTGPAAGCHRRPITYTDKWTDTTQPAYAANVGAGAVGPACPWGGTHNGTGLCVFPSSGYNTRTKDAVPAGYTESFGEWWKVD